MQNKNAQILNRILPLLMLLIWQPSLAQISILQNKSTSGLVKLDDGVAKQDYVIKVTVREHDIEFRRVCTSSPFMLCFFNTVYPIEDSYATTVRMSKGASTVAYRIKRGLFDGLYSSIKMECQNCPGVYASQYHTPSGSSLSFSGAAIYDFGDLPKVVNLELQTTASIQGRVSLANNAVLDKDLDLSVLVLSSSNLSEQARKDIRLVKGAKSVNYDISGLSKSALTPSYRIEIRCNNCSLKGSRSFPRVLASDRSHSDINFEVELSNAAFIPAIQYLLLDASTLR